MVQHAQCPTIQTTPSYNRYLHTHATRERKVECHRDSILAGRQPVTPTTAVKLGKLCGNGPRIWLNMQMAHDLWEAERKVDVRGIPTLEVA